MTDLSFQTITPARGPLSRRIRVKSALASRARSFVEAEAMSAGFSAPLSEGLNGIRPPPLPDVHATSAAWPQSSAGAFRTARETPARLPAAGDAPAAETASPPPPAHPESPWMRSTRRRQWTTWLQVAGAWALTFAIGSFIVTAVAVLLLTPGLSLDEIEKRFRPGATGLARTLASAPRPVDRDPSRIAVSTATDADAPAMVPDR